MYYSLEVTCTTLTSSFESLLECLKDVKTWMAKNFLMLNEDKTEVIVFGHQNKPADTILDSSPLTPYTKLTVRDSGFLIDNNLKMDKQINSVVRACFYNLRLLAKIKPFLSNKDFERVIHTFIFSRLDFCNSLYYGITAASLSRLQSVQNAAGRLLLKIKKHESITPALKSLNWLPVQYRIRYKILMFVYKSLNNQAPPYLANLITLYTPSRKLRSENQELLIVPRTKRLHKGDRAFAVIGPKHWNELPLHFGSTWVVY